MPAQDSKLTLQDDMTVLMGRMEHETSLGIEGALTCFDYDYGSWGEEHCFVTVIVKPFDFKLPSVF